MWDYTEKVRDHYLHPRNVGEIPDPDGFGEVGNITCGDALRLTFKLDDKGKITDIRFKTFGCGSAIASASVLTEMCKGKTLDEVKKITNKDIAGALDGLPKEKMHCSVMGQEALDAAIRYFESGGKETKPALKEGTIVCTCFGVTDKEIETAVRENGLATVEEVTNFTKAGGGCGGCHTEIQKIIDRVHSIRRPTPVLQAPRLTTLQKIDLIRHTLESDVKPLLERDGGSCELVDLEGNTVFVRLAGHCSGCAFSTMTLTEVIEKKLRQAVADDLRVKLADER
ncbi:MAG: Fe-S cluster assembly protein NifU [Chitinispirillaceae bacterium]|jgi:NifU-like protein